MWEMSSERNEPAKEIQVLSGFSQRDLQCQNIDWPGKIGGNTAVGGKGLSEKDGMRSTGLWLERYNVFQSEKVTREYEDCKYTGYLRRRKEGNRRLFDVLDAAYGLFTSPL